MVASSAGATCLATVSLPPAARHCQAVQAIAAFQISDNSHKTMATMSAAVAVVDQLRQQLLLVVGKGDDEAAANDLITQLEMEALNKEILEITRIGRYVNDVRKQTAECWPEFSKRCRAVIKKWQKLAEYRPGSSCEGSSNGGTPQLISPALRRGLTPRTPGKSAAAAVSQQQQQRVLSTDLPLSGIHAGHLQQRTSASLSPAIGNGVLVPHQQLIVGSYAPLPPATKKLSPQAAAVVALEKHIQKSASMGAALASLSDGGVQGVQEKLESAEPEALATSLITTSAAAGSVPLALAHHQPPLMLKLKRSASGVQRLATQSSTDSGVSPPATQSSVQAARKDVQSTAELVAQLSEQLPQHIGGIFDMATTASAKEEPQIEQVNSRISPALSTTTDFISSTTTGLPDSKATAMEASTTTTSAGTSKKRKASAEAAALPTIDECDGDGKDVSDVAAGLLNSVEKTAVVVADHLLVQTTTQPPSVATAAEVTTTTTEEQPPVKRKRGRPRKNKVEPVPTKKLAATTEATNEKKTPKSAAKFNWFAKFPLPSGDEQSATAMQQVEVPQRVLSEPDRSFVLPVRDRQLLLLPYVDIGRPDWLVHDLPQQEQFLFPDPFSWPGGGVQQRK